MKRIKFNYISIVILSILFLAYYFNFHSWIYYSISFIVLIFIVLIFLRYKKDILDKPVKLLILKRKILLYNLDKLIVAFIFIFIFINEKALDVRGCIFYSLIVLFCVSLIKISISAEDNDTE